MKIYKRKISFFKKNSFLDNIFNSPFVIIFINWLFQGIRGMQSKELFFRLILELIFILFFNNIIKLNLIFSLIISHTFFWIFFCHFWVVIRYLPIYNNNLVNMNITHKNLIIKVINFKFINEAIIIGSVSKKNKIENINSDVDLRIFFKKGFLEFFLINLFMYYLRFYSFLMKFPLDIYSYDNFSIFKKIDKRDKIRIIKDHKKKIKKYLKKL
mgnify:CR=1 FL=1|jgi:hypothetical protein